MGEGGPGRAAAFWGTAGLSAALNLAGVWLGISSVSFLEDALGLVVPFVPLVLTALVAVPVRARWGRPIGRAVLVGGVVGAAAVVALVGYVATHMTS
ncbi:hypothetical protein ACIRN4_26945 [Pimelobacter simplex]|uniref:hypothetical protein n=1 Tax=Nocardioides simplex TaxID=2045 RepID=UPI00381E8BF2